jgi:hypothetical protein
VAGHTRGRITETPEEMPAGYAGRLSDAPKSLGETAYDLTSVLSLIRDELGRRGLTRASERDPALSAVGACDREKLGEPIRAAWASAAGRYIKRE